MHEVFYIKKKKFRGVICQLLLQTYFFFIILVSYIVGKLTELIGRKWVLLAAAPIFIISFILMMIASEVWIIIFARALQGCATGFVMTATSIYVSEISTDKLRGAIGSLMQLAIVSK